jgi:hypothetical protein
MVNPHDPSGPSIQQSVYAADLEFEGVPFPNELVVGSDDFVGNSEPWALIGRDLLNRALEFSTAQISALQSARRVPDLSQELLF